MGTLLLEALKKQVLVCDGAMGTQLMARGLAPGVCGEQWNLERPDAVTDIHQAYRAAGCNLLTTNTFGGTRTALERHGLERQVHEINAAGVECAQKALEKAGVEGWVLGDVGPFGGFLEPMGDTKPGELEEIFVEQMEALAGAGADAAIIETMGDPGEMAVAVRAARRGGGWRGGGGGGWAVIATYAFARSPGGQFRTMMGTDVAHAVGTAVEAGADVVGANCGTKLSLDDYERLAAELVTAAGEVPVILQPNAGSPQMEGGRLVYCAGPADMAELAKSFLEAGVRIIGGCCGTTPEHLAAMAKVVRRK